MHIYIKLYVMYSISRHHILQLCKPLQILKGNSQLKTPEMKDTLTDVLLLHEDQPGAREKENSVLSRQISIAIRDYY